MPSPRPFILQTDYDEPAVAKTAPGAKPEPEAAPSAGLPSAPPLVFNGLPSHPATSGGAATPAVPTRLSSLSVDRSTPLPLTLTPFARALLRG